MTLLLAVTALAACGGGGGGGGGGTAVSCSGTGSVSLSGTATFEDVPAVSNGIGSFTRLDYLNSVSKPIREAEVRIECADGSTSFAETVTDTNGEFSATIPENVDARIVVRARSIKTGAPAWDFSVVDNTSSQAVWAMVGDSFNTGTGSVTADIEAGSGWSGSAYGGDRIGGAFSIYDTVYEAVNLVVGVEPGVQFTPLLLNWSPNNTASVSCSGDREDGCIGTSFYSGGEIYILGAADDDTDEYDDSVVAHEWGHYYEDSQARSDSVGGSHSGGDVLDIRVAFGEGWGNALSGMIIGDTMYRDTYGDRQASGFSIGLESESVSNPGWFNETSVQLILFDIFDSVDDGADTLSEGFGPIHAVLTGQQKNTEAFTSIFPFITYMKANGTSSAGLDSLTVENGIAAITDIWGSSRSNKGPVITTGVQAAVDPVYLEVTTEINNGTGIDVCITDEYGEYNKLGTRRFLKFIADESRSYRFELNGRVTGIDQSDPDIFLFDLAASGDDLFEFAGADWSSPDSTSNPDAAVYGDSYEVASAALTAGNQYVIDAHEWMNHDRDVTTGGEGCLTLTATKL